MVHIAVSVAMSNAGEASRALAIAKGVRRLTPDGVPVHISVISQGGRFDTMATDAGFDLVACEPRFHTNNAMSDLGRDLPELVGSEQIARDLIQGQLDVLQDLHPDVVLHGFWPFASLAAHRLGIPTIAFLPLPLEPECVGGGLFVDIPDETGVPAHLPAPVRRRLARLAAPLMTRVPFFNQHRVAAAAASLGWRPTGRSIPLWEANAAELVVVNDLPRFHSGYPKPDKVKVTGPIFPGWEELREGRDPASLLDHEVVELLSSGGRPSVLVAMGSSGSKDMLLQAARALAPNADLDVNAVILVPPAICPPELVHEAAGGSSHVLATDEFLPALALSQLVDVVVSHGGQGTVQTTMAAGTPLVGVGNVVEQQLNLQHVMDAGAGIRIQQFQWKPAVIRHAVQTVLADPSYKHHASMLADEIATIDGASNAAQRIWEFLTARSLAN